MNKKRILFTITLIPTLLLQAQQPAQPVIKQASKLDQVLAKMNMFAGRVGKQEVVDYKQAAVKWATDYRASLTQNNNPIEFNRNLCESGWPMGIFHITGKVFFDGQEYSPDINEPNLNAFLDHHMALKRKLDGKLLHSDVQDLLSSEFFKNIDAETTRRQIPFEKSGCIAGVYLNEHYKVIEQAAFQMKLILGAAALTAGITLSAKLLFDKYKEKNKKKEQASKPVKA